MAKAELGKAGGFTLCGDHEVISAQNRILQFLPALLNSNCTGSDFPGFCVGVFFTQLFRCLQQFS